MGLCQIPIFRRCLKSLPQLVFLQLTEHSQTRTRTRAVSLSSLLVHQQSCTMGYWFPY
uniref:Uncharacterized protein n=1 Tax=Rhizophora mucronata TaxID=61149 RepID=A0A2P2QFU3_RHIMU